MQKLKFKPEALGKPYRSDNKGYFYPKAKKGKKSFEFFNEFTNFKKLFCR